MLLPEPRGPWGSSVIDALRTGDTNHLPPVSDDLAQDALNEDEQLILWVLYEQHYRGFHDVAPDLEWHPDLIRIRRALEQRFEHTLRSRTPELPEAWKTEEPEHFAKEFFAFVEHHDGPSLSGYIRRHATPEQVEQFLRHKSIYHLKESDHTTWVIPRVSDTVKAAVMELQYDEYGAGNPHRLHAHLFEQGLIASGIDHRYGAHINEAPLEILEQNNAMNLFGLNRKLRAASLGFLAAFETTSSVPSRRIAQGLQRLEFPAEMIEYYTEHVEADAVHEQLAVRTICGTMLIEDPTQLDRIFFGAWTSLDMEDRYAHLMLTAWEAA